MTNHPVGVGPPIPLVVFFQRNALLLELIEMGKPDAKHGLVRDYQRSSGAVLGDPLAAVQHSMQEGFLVKLVTAGSREM
jgi:hypothetical protein